MQKFETEYTDIHTQTLLYTFDTVKKKTFSIIQCAHHILKVKMF